MTTKNTRRGNTQPNERIMNMGENRIFDLFPLEAEGGRRPDEGESKIKAFFINKSRCLLTCPNGHPLPQGRGGTLYGFTLIELLVVVLIIGILAAVAVPQYQKAVEKSRTAEAVTFVKNLADAEKIFYLAHGEYTNDFSQLDMGTEVSDSNYETKDWKYMLKTDRAVPRVVASRTAYAENEGQYNIGYDLLYQEFFCSANKNTKGVEFCKTLAATVRACNHSAGDPCYYF